MLTAAEVQAVLDGCEHLRDRLLFAVLLDCGVRIGEALGLRHEDMGIADRTVAIVPRANDSGARAKAGIARTIPASGELMRLYADYLTREYGSLDSDYVFVNLWAQPYGRSWTYAAVYELVLRLRERTGIDFGPHQWRHTYATGLLRRGSQSASNQLAAWVYDNSNNAVSGMTDAIGQLTTQTAYSGGAGGAAYVTQAKGFNAF
ncbi:MAG TPA: tyrosine-type recombinase/integrase, partial [Streptosporangiaceae bacterium]|nr:tyrosine-type recombinase/integrase [Streptosporangiaceae bacterium]